MRPDFAMLMTPYQDETAVHGSHYQGDMVLRMCKIMAKPRGWCSVLPCGYSSSTLSLRYEVVTCLTHGMALQGREVGELDTGVGYSGGGGGEEGLVE